jgi:hypothetical protein
MIEVPKLRFDTDNSRPIEVAASLNRLEAACERLDLAAKRIRRFTGPPSSRPA